MTAGFPTLNPSGNAGPVPLLDTVVEPDCVTAENATLTAAVPDLDAHLAKGETSGAVEWLRENLQRHGGLRSPRETIAHACGFEPSEGPLLDYLEAKFGALYLL